jgi:hypothetical protein
MKYSLAACAALLLAVALPTHGIAATASTAIPKCPASDPVVWVNTSSNIYHPQGDKYFGNTKAGKYECTSQAKAAGARASEQGGGTSGKSTSATATTKKTPAPAAMRTPMAPMPGMSSMPGMAMPAPTATPKKHSKNKPAAVASPSPAPLATATPRSHKKKKAAPAASPTPAATATPRSHHKKKTPVPSPTPTT